VNAGIFGVVAAVRSFENLGGVGPEPISFGTFIE
jgi:hypothetical protein